MSINTQSLPLPANTCLGFRLGLLSCFFSLWLLGYVAAWQAPQTPDEPAKITGHWGEDAIGFRWTEQDSVDGRWQQTDVGPFLSTTIPIAGRAIAKGRVIQVRQRVTGPSSNEASPSDATPNNVAEAASIPNDYVVYDSLTGLCEGWWQGDSPVRFSPARYGLIEHPNVSGPLRWHRPTTIDEQIPKYQHRTMLQHAEQVVLEGEIEGVVIREHAEVWAIGKERTALKRSLWIAPHEKSLLWNPSIPVAAIEEWQQAGDWIAGRWRVEQQAGWLFIRSRSEEQSTSIDWPSLTAKVQAGCVELPPMQQPLELELLVLPDDVALDAIESLLVDIETLDWDQILAPSDRIWDGVIVTAGTRGAERRGLRMDTIELPTDNPYRALMFLSGIDFVDSDTAMISTVHGDVWRVEGLDESLSQVKWSRYATGLFQPLGLKIVDGDVYVLGRDQLTKLIDRNGDGEADEYWCVNNQAPTSLGTHDYAACLEVDAEGRFLSVRGNTGVERIARDGSSYEVIATGLRNPNGLGVGPNDLITVSPQEGEWTPASSIAVAREGGHYGYQGPRITDQRPLGYDPPMLWLPRLLDNSSGGQVWIPEQGWGGIGGNLIHLSFGRCWPLLILPEQVGSQWQAGAIRLPFECDSGVCRGRVQPETGALFLAGLKGWASASAQDGCLHRLVRTQAPMTLPVALETRANGLLVRFDHELDESTAQDRGRWSAQIWNYRYSAEYGSADYRPSRPAQPGHDELPIRSVTLQPDRKSVFVEIPKIAPVMQLALSYDLQTVDAIRINDTIYQTIHELRSEQGTAGPHAQDLIEDVAVDQLRPGFLLGFSQVALSGEVVRDYRVARRLALTRSDQSLSPWIDSRSFDATFEGWWQTGQRETTTLVVISSAAFEVEFRGELLTAIHNEGNRFEYGPIVLEKGLNQLRINWSCLGDEEATLEVLASTEGGFLGPIPAERLRHDPRDARLQLAQERRTSRLELATRHCFRCHDLDPSLAASANRMPELDDAPPSLTGAAHRLQQDWIYEWLLNPQALNRHATMPRLLDANDEADQQVARDLTAYLSTLVDAHGESPDGSGNDNGRSDEAIEAGRALVEEVGCVACHVHEARANDARRGWEHVGRKFTFHGLVDFLRDPGAHYPATQMPRFTLNEEERLSIAKFLVSLSSDKENEAQQRAGDWQRGRVLFESIGCAACHDRGDELPRVDLRIPLLPGAKGCLATEERDVVSVNEGVRIAHFDWDPGQAESLAQFLDCDIRSLGRDARLEIAERTLQRLNCAACHGRDGEMGDLAMILFEESEQGLSPEFLPDLSWVDDKLRSDWTAEFIANSEREPLRPWLRARMPAFPWHAERLAQGWSPEQKVREEEESSWYATDAAMVEAGARLISPLAFDCRQCHALGAEPATGDQRSQIALGINFVETGHRLRSRYFHQWMADPLAIDPLTKMPRYSEDGLTTKVGDILQGSAMDQFEAIRQYLRSAAASDLLHQDQP